MSLQDVKKKGELDLCITVLVQFKKMKQKACVKQKIMYYYDYSLFTQGRLESHLGSSYDWDRLTSVANELASMKWTTTFSTTFSFCDIWGGGDTFCSTFLTTFFFITSARTGRRPSPLRPHGRPLLNNVFSRSSDFHHFSAAHQGSCSKWPSFLTFADTFYLMRVKSSRLDD